MQVAIEHALTVLTWFENLPKEEVPPEHLWEDSEGLELWWERLAEAREDGRSPSRRASVGDDDEEGGSEMAQNDLAAALKR